MFQFLWRDLSSEFDLIGPYFESEAGMKHQFVMTCILITTHAFQLYSFEVMAIVLDGASKVAKWYFSLHFCCEAACAQELYYMTVDNKGGEWKH